MRNIVIQQSGTQKYNSGPRGDQNSALSQWWQHLSSTNVDVCIYIDMDWIC